MIRLHSLFLFAATLAAVAFPHASYAQTPANISAVQGNGQLVCDSCPFAPLPVFDPLVVLVTDANNNPVPDAFVTWTVTSSTFGALGAVNGSTTTTTTTGSSTSSSAVACTIYNSSGLQANGQTCVQFAEGSSASSQNTFIQNTVTASISNGNSVTFYLTQSPAQIQAIGTPNPGYVQAQVSPSSPIAAGSTINGPVNSVYGSSFVMQVSTITGTPVPNVSVRFYPEAVTLPGPTIMCQTPSGTYADPGSVLTDQNGNGTCVPVFGPTPGSTPNHFGLLVGGVLNVQNPANGTLGSYAGVQQIAGVFATANPVSPGSLTIVSGNSQTALAGSTLPNPLVVLVNDTNGNALQGATVTWSVSPSGAANLSATSSTTGSNGQASTNVTLNSSASGTVTVTATVSGIAPVSFTITATQPTPPITNLTLVSGNNQSVQAGAQFAPLTVAVTPATPGITVQFAVTGGSATPATSSATTNAQGQASVILTAGNAPGPVGVVASVSGFSTTLSFSLTVTPPPPPINSASFLNGAGFFGTSGTNFTALSPCGVGTLVVGSPLSSTALPLVPNMYATPLQQTNNTSLNFPSASGTSAAPILNMSTASTEQQLITFQVPCDATPSNATVAVSVNGNSVSVGNVTVRPAAPGIFETTGADGVRRAVAVRPDGSIVTPTNPARQGDFVRIYLTGVGPTSPPLSTGGLPVFVNSVDSGVDAVPTGDLIVALNNVPVGAVTVRAATDLIGVFEVVFEVPSNSSSNPIQTGDNLLSVGVIAQSNPVQFGQPSGSQLPIQ